MTEDQYREQVYQILSEKYGMKVRFDLNEQGWYDPYIEDCYREGYNAESCARGLVHA